MRRAPQQSRKRHNSCALTPHRPLGYGLHPCRFLPLSRWSRRSRGNSTQTSARAHLDRVADQLGGRLILVRPHPKARRNAGTWTYRAAMIAGGALMVPWTGPLLGEANLAGRLARRHRAYSDYGGGPSLDLVGADLSGVALVKRDHAQGRSQDRRHRATPSSVIRFIPGSSSDCWRPRPLKAE